LTPETTNDDTIYDDIQTSNSQKTIDTESDISQRITDYMTKTDKTTQEKTAADLIATIITEFTNVTDREIFDLFDYYNITIRRNEPERDQQSDHETLDALYTTATDNSDYNDDDINEDFYGQFDDAHDCDEYTFNYNLYSDDVIHQNPKKPTTATAQKTYHMLDNLHMPASTLYDCDHSQENTDEYFDEDVAKRQNRTFIDCDIDHTYLYCMCVYVCVFLCACVCVYMYECIHSCVDMCIRAYLRVCMRIGWFIGMCVGLFVYVNIYLHICSFIFMYITVKWNELYIDWRSIIWL
jgi:hypothetical protein